MPPKFLIGQIREFSLCYDNNHNFSTLTTCLLKDVSIDDMSFAICKCLIKESKLGQIGKSFEMTAKVIKQDPWPVIIDLRGWRS